MFNAKRYGVELGGALALYGLSLFESIFMQRMYHPTGLWLYAVSLLPMTGVIAGAWVILRALHRMDELQKRIQLEAVALAFLGTALITFGWGIAEHAGLIPLRAFAVWPIMGSLWGMSLAFMRWKYR